MTSFYTEEQLKLLGFKSLGKGCKISRYAQFYGIENISIGDNVRIDDFCIISGDITIGNNIHISAYVALYGGYGITLEDYTGISPRSTIFSSMDDFSGDFLIGPIHPTEKTNVKGGKVTLQRYAQIGAHCVIFPSISIGEGAVVGAMSLVNKDVEPWSIVIGQPAHLLKYRNKGLLNLI